MNEWFVNVRGVCCAVMCVGLMLSSPPELSAQTTDAPLSEGPDAFASWRVDPVVLHDMNLARGATPHAGELMIAAQFDALGAMPLVMSSLGCAHRRDLPNAHISLWSCDDAMTARARILMLSSRYGVWSEASFYETPSQGLDPAMDYDLDIKQWHHQNRSQNVGGRIGVMGADIGSLEAWRNTPGDTPGMLVAVIDSGIDFTHPDLAPLEWTNRAEVCGNNLDDDRNGYVDDCVGWDFGDEDNEPSPRSLPGDPDTCKRWHGTYIAGLSSAVGDNQEGGAGVHWGSKLLNIKKHDDATCVSRTSQSIESITYAVEMGVKIVQMSFNSSAASVMFENTLRNAVARDVLLVTSAGNDGLDNDKSPVYPGSYGIEGQLVVAATTNQDQLSQISNFGAFSVDLAAPGEHLYSSDEEKDYAIRTGTSYAVPLVAGVASLVRASFPELSARQVAAAILEGVEPLDALNCTMSPDACVASGGRLYAPGALEAASNKLSGASISIQDLRVVDLAGDGFLSAGERATVSYTLLNRGLASTKLALSVEVLGSNDVVTVTPPLLTLPPLDKNQRFSPSVQQKPSLIINPSCSRNETVTLVFTLQDDQSRIWVSEVEASLACGLDADGDGVPPPQDCRDDNAKIAPNLPEVCDGLDNNCNNKIDENPQSGTRIFYLDTDGDGFGSSMASVMACALPTMYAPVDGDCDDTNAQVMPYVDATSGRTVCGVPPVSVTPPSEGCNCSSVDTKTPRHPPLVFALWMGLVAIILGVRARRPRQVKS